MGGKTCRRWERFEGHVDVGRCCWGGGGGDADVGRCCGWAGRHVHVGRGLRDM